jgi:hypothetical protein
MDYKKLNNLNFTKRLQLFFYTYEYLILEMAGIISGLVIILIANNYFVATRIYYIIFVFGLLVCSLGFLLEYLIKNDKRKSIDQEFGYFLYDLGKEYKNVNNISLALTNVSESNFYGSIHGELKRLANRVSWGQSFLEALKDTNKVINSTVIKHTISLLKILEKSKMPYHKVLINLSKDVNIFKQETKNKKYFSNLFFLSIVFYFIFVFVLLYIDFIVGKNFFWFSQIQTMTRLFLDNFLLYIALLLGFFTSFVLYNIKNKNIYVFWRYIFIFFISTVVLFQVFVPNPDAQEVLIESINYLNENKEDLNLDTIVLNKVIAIKSISSKEIVENSFAEMVHFIPFEKKECGVDCAKYTILLEDPNFFNFEIQILEDNVYYIYYKKESNY